VIRILWLTKGLGPGGAEQLLVNVARARPPSDLDYEVLFVRPDKGHLAPALREVGVTVHEPERPFRRWPLRLAGLVRSGRYDIVHSHSPVMAGVARLASRTLPRRRRPVLVATEHNVWDSYPAPTRWLNALTFGLDDAHVAVSDAARESVWKRQRDGVEVLVHGIPLDEVRAARSERSAVRTELGIDDDEVVVVTVANYRVNKAWPSLLQAAAAVVETGAGVRFVGVGQGPLQSEVEAEHTRLDLGDRFLLLGYRPDAVRVMSGGDVFCLASSYEGLPVALMEARAIGLPVVATSVGGVTGAVRDGVDGRLVPPGRPDLLADALVEVVTDPERRQSMAASAAARADEYGVDRAVARLETLYRTLVAERRRA